MTDEVKLIKTPLDVCIIKLETKRLEYSKIIEKIKMRELRSTLGVRSFANQIIVDTTYNVLHGLYLSYRPQDRLVMVNQGTIYAVGVDLREDSPTLGTWVGSELDHLNMFWCPHGYAFGFIVTSPTAKIEICFTHDHEPENESIINWNDQDLKIDWERFTHQPLLCSRDRTGVDFSTIKKIKQ